MLRVLFGPKDVMPWVLTEDEFLRHIDQLAAKGFAGIPPGRVAVEAVDERDRIQWRAYYAKASDLLILAQHIREGRAATAQRRPEPTL